MNIPELTQEQNNKLISFRSDLTNMMIIYGNDNNSIMLTHMIERLEEHAFDIQERLLK
jgi:hypothetical protein